MNTEAMLKKRSDLLSRRERLLGKLEAARENLSKIDQRLREKGIDPDSLEEEIRNLFTDYKISMTPFNLNERLGI